MGVPSERAAIFDRMSESEVAMYVGAHGPDALPGYLHRRWGRLIEEMRRPRRERTQAVRRERIKTRRAGTEAA